jgi:hypothetical protein
MTAADTALARFWWQDMSIRRVAPHDYPRARVHAARERMAGRSGRLEPCVKEIVRRSRSPETAVRGIARFVQDALMHPPLLQPSDARWAYWKLRRAGVLPARLAGHEEVRAAMHQRLIMEPELLLELGEGRCGQCSAVLCAALRLAGFSTQPWQLPHHIAVEVIIDDESCVIDADAFKNGVFLEIGGRIATKRDVEKNPYLVDRFKPTGWMFRRDSVYARDAQTGRPYEGYVDFYSPEDDGQISGRYAAPRILRPPGVPRWMDIRTPLIAVRGQTLDLSFSCRHADRAKGYRVRCGRESRGYTYDHLVLPLLARETSRDIFEFERAEPNVSFRLDERGRYFVSAAAIPSYSDEFPSYVWWSDELIIDVV